MALQACAWENARQIKKLQDKLEAMLSLFSPHQLIAYHRNLYYNGIPEITDEKYDKLVKSLDSYY